MTNQIESFEREVLRALFSCPEWYDLYALHERFLLSPGQLAHAVRAYEADGLVESDGLNARLTQKGRVWVFENRRRLFLNEQRRTWADIPSFIRIRSLAPTEPYLPRLKDVSTNFFKQK